jgi:hypothetical protein
MDQNTALPFALPACAGRKVSAAFDGGVLTSDAGVVLLGQMLRASGLASKLAGRMGEWRDPCRVRHSIADMIAARMLAIAAGYEDCDDHDGLRGDAAFLMALGRAPCSGQGLASQPSLSRLENRAGVRELAGMMGAMVDFYCASYPEPPASVMLDIDDTFDAAHGGQQLAFWNGFHQERGFAPLHVYDSTGRPVGVFLRPARTPSGKEAAGHIRRLVHAIRRHWPNTAITIRGDGHFGRPEVMDWCEKAGVDYILGLPGNAALRADPVLAAASDGCAVFRAERKLPVHRVFTETLYGAKSWGCQRRVIARIEASTMGMDVRTIVTSLQGSTPERLYEFVYCQRGQAENWIKQHKAQLHSDRTSCTSANANQLRLILHTGAYWLLWLLRNAIPAASTLKTACFTTLQLRLVKLAARVRETATRVRLAFAAACPDQELITALFRHRALRHRALGPTASVQPAGP